MTVAANSRRREYLGNGVTTNFNGPSAYGPEEITAFLFEGDASTPVSPDDYQVSNFGRESGTRVEMAVPPAPGQTLVLLRTVPYVQPVDITNQGAFLPETVEKGYDNIVFQTQQLADGQERSLRYPDEFPGTGISLELPIPVAGRALVWDETATRIVNASLEGAGDLLLRGHLAEAGPGRGAHLVEYAPGVTVADRLDATAVVQSASFTYTCPGDFATLQEAIDTLSRRVFPQGAVIDLLIPAGSTFPGRVYVTDGDYSMFRIVSEDAVVDVPLGFTGTLIAGYRCRMPSLATVVDMKNLGAVGYGCYRGSIGHLEDGAGCINCLGHGLEARGSFVYCENSVWTGCGVTGIRAEQSATISAQGADVSNTKYRGLYVSRASTVNFMNGVATNCGNEPGDNSIVSAGAIIARRSYINASESNVAGSYNGVYGLEASNIAFNGSNADGCGMDGVRASGATRVDASGCSAVACGNRAYRAEDAATINAKDSSGHATGSTYAISVERGSFVTASNYTVEGVALTPNRTNIGVLNELTSGGVIFT